MKKQAPRQHPHTRQTCVALWASLFMGLVASGSSACASLAQAGAIAVPPPQSTGNLPSAGTPVVKTVTARAPAATKPAWQDLTAAQQEALRPLGAKWHELSQDRKRKWLEVSKNFAALPPAEQTKMHSRMTEWVSLSLNQRAQARLNFAETQRLSPAEKSARWQAYQSLSPEEKQKLAAKAPAKPAGAAIVRPQPSPKFANVPFTRNTPKHGAALSSSVQPLDKNTLLPKTEIEAETVSGPVEIQKQ